MRFGNLGRVGALVMTACTALVAAPVTAGEADVVDVEIACRPAPGNRPQSICQLTVAVQHADAGWDHFANRFEVVGPKGGVLGTRVLRHPHVEEQPFRRSLARVRIPHSVGSVTIRAHDLVHELGGAEQIVKVPHAGVKSTAAKEGAAKEGEATREGADKNKAAASDR